MDKKVKIIHISQANGGVERYLNMFFKYSKDIFENQVIVSKQFGESINKFREMGIKVHVIDMEREINPVKDIKTIIQIYKILKSEKCSIVYTHSSKAGGVGRLPAKLLGYINIYNPHGWSFDMDISKKKKIVFQIVEKFLANITDKIVAISNHEKRIALENKICSKDKVVVVENAVDLKFINHIYCEEKKVSLLKKSESQIIVGMVARISKQKSPEVFLNIAEKVIKTNKNVIFVIVGDGDERQHIESLIDKKKIRNNIKITGWVNNVEEYIKEFDIALLTSKWEGFGLVVAEYMAMKKPVIASNVGGISNIIENEKNGYLIDNLNEDEFVNKINHLINNQVKSREIAGNGYKTAIEKYDFNRLIEEHNNIFTTELSIKSKYKKS